jgi:L,D-transpeptidase YcbB
MSNTSLKIAASIVALAFAMGTADAEVRKPQRKSFFERLFSSSPKTKRQKQQQRKTIFSWSGQDDEVNIVYGNERRARRAYVDPEPLPTLGMGNRDYVETKRVPVFDSAVAKAQGSTPEAEAIRQQLASKSTDLRAVQTDRDAIIAHYKQTGFKPFWMSSGKLTDRGTQLLATLEKAAEHGLSPDRYKTAALQEKARSLDTSIAGELDVALTIAALEYARELNSGQFEPNRLSAYHDLTPEHLAPETILRVLAYSPFPQNYLDSLAPRNAEYALLKDELKKVENDITTKPFKPFEMTGKRVKAGQSDARIPDLRERMLELGHIEPGEALVAEGDRDILDKALSVALKSFQKSNGIKATGSLDKSTELVLNTDARKRQRDKLLVNMERIRWLPKDLGQRHVFVNQAGFEVVVRDNGAEAWRSKVIVGKPMTQTYVFNDTMETVVFNPSWGVPQSIIVNEYMPKLRRDPGYLDKQGFKVINSKGKVVSSRSVNWGAYGNKVPFGVQQPPGGENALGEIKFLFPNGHDIYMHDTPSRNLFDESTRAFSHGCVRVHNPRDFATVLLGWDRDKVDANVESGESQSVRVPNKWRVHLNYFTAWPDKDGKITYHSDIYGRDETILKALEARRDKTGERVAVTLVKGSSAQQFIAD